MMMKMIFNELYLFSPSEKLCRKISLKEGVNVITSNAKDGTDRGKSVIMRSFYHTLGAESDFDNKWDKKNKVFILKLSIDEKQYYIYRAADLYKFFNAEKELLFVASKSKELARKMAEYTRFSVLLPSRQNDKLEITSTVYNYLPFFLDQDHYDGSKFTSFKNLGEYEGFKENVLFYHFGAHDTEYFDLIRERESAEEREKTCRDRDNLLNTLQEDIEQKLEIGSYSGDVDSLNRDIEQYKREYAKALSALNGSKSKLIKFRNSVVELESLLEDINISFKDNEKRIKKLNNRTCPECGTALEDVIKLKSKRYNISEDYIAIKNELQKSIHEVELDIEKEESNYEELLSQLKRYEEKLEINTKEVSNVLRHKGLCEIRDSVVNERSELYKKLMGIEEELKEIKRNIKKYNEKKKEIQEKYYELLVEAKYKFGLSEIDPDKFKKITSIFSASGSNKNIATVIWYLTLIKLRSEFNPEAIEFPVVFDSPNNVETDDEKKHDLIQYIFDKTKECSQVIMSSIGFNCDEFEAGEINVITLSNDKYALLSENDYLKYENLLSEFCDAEID